MHQRRPYQGPQARRQVFHKGAKGLHIDGGGPREAPNEALVEIVLSPHRALGHARRTAGVEKQHVVAAAKHLRRRAVILGHLLEALGSDQIGEIRFVSLGDYERCAKLG